jgi:hypothetical protein
MPKFLTSVDLAKNELQNAKLHPLAADPTPAAGDKGYVIYNTSTNQAKVWNGTAFDVLATGTTTFGSPGASAVGDSATDGVSTASARADHQHSREAFGAVVAATTFGIASGNGAATTVARSDHAHGTPATPSASDVGAVANAGTTPSVQAGTTGTRPAFGTAGRLYLSTDDFSVSRDTGTAWVAYPGVAAPGSSAVGDGVAAGTAVSYARSDHVHGRESFGAVSSEVAYGISAADGAATTVARSDHTHGSPTAPTASSVGAVANVSSSAPSIQEGTNGSRPAAGTAGRIYFDTTNVQIQRDTGAAWDPFPAMASPGSSLASDSVGAGTATSLARSDHVHGREGYALVAAITGLVPDQVAAAGTATTVARGDHAHNIAGAAPSGSSIASDTNSEGSSSSFARADHVHGREGFAASTTAGLLGATPSNGSATTLARGDHQHNITANTAADAWTPGASAAVGTSSDVARADHAHSVTQAPTFTGVVTSGGFALTTGTITNVPTPSAGTDAANKSYVDATATGLDVKASVRLATTANVVIATGGLQTIDDVVTVTGDRVLLKNQSAPAENGIYQVNAGAWTRTTDADTSVEVTSGMFTFVEEGTVNADTGWVLSTNATITLGSTSLTFVQFSGAGSYLAGNGLTLTGSTFAVGAGDGISSTASTTSVRLLTNGGLQFTTAQIGVKTTGTTGVILDGSGNVVLSGTYPGQASITTLGTITTGTWTGTDIAVADGGTGASTAAAARANLGATTKVLANSAAALTTTVAHGLATAELVVTVREASTGNLVFPDISCDSTNVVVTFAVAPTASQYKIVIVG